MFSKLSITKKNISINCVKDSDKNILKRCWQTWQTGKLTFLPDEMAGEDIQADTAAVVSVVATVPLIEPAMLIPATTPPFPDTTPLLPATLPPSWKDAEPITWLPDIICRMPDGALEIGVAS